MTALPHWAKTLAEITHTLEKIGACAEIHVRLLAVTDAVDPEQPDAGVVLHTAGQIWARLGDFDMARLLFERGLRLLERTLLPDEPYLVLCLQSLAGVHLYAQPVRPELAMPLLQRALGILSLGEENTMTAELLHHLAQAHLLENRPDAARPLLRKALSIYEAQEGDSSPHVAAILNTLALVSDADSARVLRERALAIASASAPELAESLRSRLSRGRTPDHTA